MPTLPTHVLAGLAVGEVFAFRPLPGPYYLLCAALGVLPDLDVAAFRLGIPYGARFGHRGFSHSLCFALVAMPIALATAGPFAVPWWLLACCFFAIVAGHGALDALTNGGMGIAFFSPFDPTRYFFPWRPVQVSPIGWRAVSRWGLRALLSEMIWVWLPLGVLVGVVVVARRGG